MASSGAFEALFKYRTICKLLIYKHFKMTASTEISYKIELIQRAEGAGGQGLR